MYIGPLLDWRDLKQPPRNVLETLRFEDSSVPPPLSEEESYVKVKDRAIQVIEE